MGFYKNNTSGSPRGGYSREKRTYPDESTRMLYLPKGGSRIIRILDLEPVRVKKAWVEGPQRQSRAGKTYTPWKLIPYVKGMPYLEDRCALSALIPNQKATEVANFKIFDFGCYHVERVERRTGISVSHTPCKSPTYHPNPDACPDCKAEKERILGGFRVLPLNEPSQTTVLAQHEKHILQFPGSRNTAKFFGKKVKSVSARCAHCNHEVFNESRLQMMTPEQVVESITTMTHECPSCGEKDHLVETTVCAGEEVRRGQMTWKNVEVKRATINKKSRTVFSSDLFPFESLKDSAERMEVPYKMFEEAMNREFDFAAAAAPYGINPETFKDKEKYVKLITNKQVFDINNVLYGYKKPDEQQCYLKNPFFK